jgi:hypothetical protein
MSPALRARLQAALPYLLIALAVALLFKWMIHIPPTRVGDGAEYYAMFLAWDVTHLPYMTPAAYDAYHQLLATPQIPGLLPKSWFDAAFPELIKGATSDYNHFWLYSLLALGCSKLAALAGVHLTIHNAFMALHAVLLAGTFAMAWRYWRVRGVAAVLLLTVASPLLWFFNKAHTEVFTVCVLLCAMMQMMRRNYLAAGFFLALAATQNPSFALIAGLPVFYRVVLQWRRRWTAGEALLFLATVATVLLHPVYYFWRYGVPTPQLLAPGAKLGGNLSSFYIWLLDPDVGLFPNWPLGAVALLAGIAAWLWSRRRRQAATQEAAPDWYWRAFALVYLAVNFYAHSSTTNINSGATPGLARYALWYMPLSFPYVLAAAQRWRADGMGAMLAAIVLALCVFSVQDYDPRLPEQYSRPSPASLYVQSRMPWLYTPPPEIFMERYSGYGEARSLTMLIGPDCRKALVVHHPRELGASAPRRCLFDPALLNALGSRLAGPIKHYEYMTLSESQAQSLLLVFPAGQHRIGINASGNFILADQWAEPEEWGAWSLGPRATLALPCDSRQYIGNGQPFTLELSLRAYGAQRLIVQGHTGELWQGGVASDGGVVKFTVPAAECRQGQVTLQLHLPDAISPFEREKSPDRRLLGIGLQSFQASR